MKIFYHLSSCTTCDRILKELNLPEEVQLHDVKSSPLTEEEVDQLQSLAGSYEALFSKRAQLYRQRELNNMDLQEEDYRRLLLEHYTFLKRPVLVYEQRIFVGNSKKTVAEAKAFLQD
ncbi:arsenate reductase family protein [Croceiramulus getboli]|nr:ArsC/Spx/MgsR family protein [Flavobacteriaceae bacterium YJPT1-3]